MTNETILEAIDAEISKLKQARALLVDQPDFDSNLMRVRRRRTSLSKLQSSSETSGRRTSASEGKPLRGRRPRIGAEAVGQPEPPVRSAKKSVPGEGRGKGPRTAGKRVGKSATATPPAAQPAPTASKRTPAKAKTAAKKSAAGVAAKARKSVRGNAAPVASKGAKKSRAQAASSASSQPAPETAPESVAASVPTPDAPTVEA